MKDQEILKRAEQIHQRNAQRATAKQAREARKLIGKCYRYRNCYSSPENESDYWWLFVRIDSVSKHGGMNGLQFQTDKDGVHEIKTARFVLLHSGHEEITAEHFNHALRELKTQVAKLK